MEAVEEKNGRSYDVSAEIVRRKEVGDRITEYWVDTVINSMDHKWFTIYKEGNSIKISPVTIELIK